LRRRACPSREVAASRGERRDPDRAVDQAYDAAGTTWRFYAEVFGRDSIDDRGRRLVSSVHYGKRYDNAFWDGEQMVYRRRGRGRVHRLLLVFGRDRARVDA
jgi:Zn-dependent metalloprotease